MCSHALTANCFLFNNAGQSYAVVVVVYIFLSFSHYHSRHCFHHDQQTQKKKLLRQICLRELEEFISIPGII